MADPITPNNEQYLAQHKDVADGVKGLAGSIASLVEDTQSIADSSAAMLVPMRLNPALLHAQYVEMMLGAYAKGLPVLNWNGQPGSSPHSAAHGIAKILVEWTSNDYPGWVMPAQYVAPEPAP